MRIYLASAAAAALLLAAGTASAQSTEVSFNANVTSDYVYRTRTPPSSWAST